LVGVRAVGFFAQLRHLGRAARSGAAPVWQFAARHLEGVQVAGLGAARFVGERFATCFCGRSAVSKRLFDVLLAGLAGL